MKPPKTLTISVFSVCLALACSGCADEGIDREDELVTEDNGRFELVVLAPANESGDLTPVDLPADLSGEPANAAVFFDPDGQFTVQVGVYREVKHAERIVHDLKSEGYPAYGSKSPEGLRVRIGYFTKLADAERFGRIFAADRGVEYWIDKRAEE